MLARPIVKICGTTSPEDARLAEKSGAGFIGIVVEHPPSPRHVSLDHAHFIAASVRVPIVAVTVNLSLDRLLHIHEVLRPVALQLHGDETPELVYQLKARGLPVWAAVAGEAEQLQRRAREMSEAGAEAVLLDARQNNAGSVVYGGTGRLSDWTTARSLVDAGLRVALAGGLTPENVADGIRAVEPWMVDVLSGVEARKGVKDAAKVRRFIQAARATG